MTEPQQLAYASSEARVHPLFTVPTGYGDYRRVSPTFAVSDVARLYRFYPTGQPETAEQAQLFASGGANEKIAILPVASDDGSTAVVRVYGGVYALAGAHEQTSFLASGKFFMTRDGLVCINPTVVDRSLLGKVVPTYRKLNKMNSEAQWAAIRSLLSEPALVDAVNEHVRNVCGGTLAQLLHRADFRYGEAAFLRGLHTPISPEQGGVALDVARRIGVIGLMLAANAETVSEASCVRSLPMTAMDGLRARLTVHPTADQAVAFSDIAGFIESSGHKRLILSGDVGTGKTLCYLLPTIAAARAGARVAVLLPNSLLVSSLVQEVIALRPGVNVVSNTGAGMQAHADAMSTGDASGCVHVGTTALLRRKGSYDIVVVDEMQKFSVAQRSALLTAGGKLIEATATCVPRTQALLSFAGLKVCRLKTRPYARAVSTQVLVAASGRAELSRLLHETLLSGAQAALVYPLREKSDDGRGAKAAFADLEQRFPGKVGLLHGKLNEAEKLAVVARMQAGALSLLVSTTVIELGITLPSLRLLAVVNPERLGLNSLHQLRGRVARHGGAGKFVLFHGVEPDGDARKRSEILCELDDGFDVADADLRLRGMGDLVQGGEQNGKSRLLFENLNITVDDVLAAAAQAERKRATAGEVASPAAACMLD